MKALISLRGCTGWSGPSLSAFTRRTFSHGAAHILRHSNNKVYPWHEVEECANFGGQNIRNEPTKQQSSQPSLLHQGNHNTRQDRPNTTTVHLTNMSNQVAYRIFYATWSNIIYNYYCFAYSSSYVISNLFRKLFITKTYLYNFDPLKPHFHIIKLGFTGYTLFFLISAQKHELLVLVRTSSSRRS